MSLRALGSLLTRRLAPCGIPRAQAESSPGTGTNKATGLAARRPARSLYTLRDLTVSYGAYGAAATAASAGFVALLYFNKDTEKSVLVAGEVTGVEARKEATSVEARKEMPHKEVFNEGDVGLEDTKVDEETMHARFEDWMKKFGRSYESKEEKVWRYEIFRETMMEADRRNKLNASKPSGFRSGPGPFSDRTKEECRSLCSPEGLWTKEDLEEFAHVKSLIAQGRVKDAEDVMAESRAKKIKGCV